MQDVTDLHVAMSLKVKNGKATNIPQSVYVDGKLAEKIDNCWRAWRQRKPEYEWRQHDARQFRREDDCFHSEKISELHVHCLGV